MRLIRRLAVMLCAVSVVIVATSCGEPSSTQESTSSAIAGSRLPVSLLRQDQVPANSRLESKDWSNYGQSLEDAVKNTSYRPKDCKAPREQQAQFDKAHPGRIGVGVSPPSDADLLYTNTIAQPGEPLDLLRRMSLGACSRVQQDHYVDGELSDRTVLAGTPFDGPAMPGQLGGLWFEQTSQTTSFPSNYQSPIRYHLYAFVEMEDNALISLDVSASSADGIDHDEFVRLLRASVENYSSSR